MGDDDEEECPNADELEQKLAPTRMLPYQIRGLRDQLSGTVLNGLIKRMEASAATAEIPPGTHLPSNQAISKADERIRRMKRAYAAYTAKLERNIDYLQSLISYNSQASSLIKYYKDRLRTAGEEATALESETNVANRLSTFYNNREKSVDPWIYYLRIIYWAVFCGLLFLFGRDFYKGGYLRRIIRYLGLAKTAVTQKVAKGVSKLRKEAAGLTKEQQSHIRAGPQSIHRASRATQPSRRFKGGGQGRGAPTARDALSTKYNINSTALLLGAFIILPFSIISLLNLIRKIFFPHCRY